MRACPAPTVRYRPRIMTLRRFLPSLAVAFSLAAVLFAGAQTASRSTNDPLARIRDEGLNRSQVMKTVRHLTDVIGPRLTGSPELKRAMFTAKLSSVTP